MNKERQEALKIIRKETPTGKDVSTLDYLQITALANGEPQPFTKEEFSDTLKRIDEEEEMMIFCGYRALKECLVVQFNYTEGTVYRAFEQFEKLKNFYKTVNISRRIQRLNDGTPAIMTASQYEKARENALEAIREQRMSRESVIFKVLITSLQDADNAPQPLKKVFEEMGSEPIDAKRREKYLSSCVYYELPNGSRSDQMDINDWTRELYEEELKTCEPISWESTTEGIVIANRKKKVLDAAIAYYNGYFNEYVYSLTGKKIELSDAEIFESLKYIYLNINKPVETFKYQRFAEMIGLLTAFRGHTKTELIPKKTTELDLLAALADRARKNGEGEAFITLNRADFAPVVDAIEEYLTQNLPNGGAIFTIKELSDADIVGFEGRNSADGVQPYEIADKRQLYRALHSGIAILQNPKEEQIDENGDFIEPQDLARKLFYIGDLKTDIAKDGFATIYEIIYDCISDLTAFNELMKCVGNAYKLPAAFKKKFRRSLSDIEKDIFNLNELLFNLYFDFEEESERELFRGFFRPLELIYPTDTAIREVTKDLKKQDIRDFYDIEKLTPYKSQLAASAKGTLWLKTNATKK